jgi:hypothetical protein
MRRSIFPYGGNRPMRIVVQADEGDEVSISADFVSIEQGVVTLEIENALYQTEAEIEAVTLTIDKARELAKALLSVVNAIEFVSTPMNVFDWDTSSRVRSGPAAHLPSKDRGSAAIPNGHSQTDIA